MAEEETVAAVEVVEAAAENVAAGMIAVEAGRASAVKVTSRDQKATAVEVLEECHCAVSGACSCDPFRVRHCRGQLGFWHLPRRLSGCCCVGSGCRFRC